MSTDVLRRVRPGAAHGGPDRPLPVAGALAAAVGVAVGLVICGAVAVIGWFLADAGAHGQTTDALRVGADAWLLGHGADVAAGGVPVGISPLGLTGLLVLVAFRSGRWAAAGAGPAPDARGLGGAVAVCAGSYVVLTVLVALVTTHAGVAPSVPRAILGALAVSVLAGGLGLAAGSGQLARWWDEAPGYACSVARGAVAAALLLLAAGASVVLVGLVLSFNDAANVFSGLHLAAGDALMLLVVSALVTPNAALLAVSWLSGPGFAVGTGTTVSTTAVALGPVPAFPLLAALPGDGPVPGWMAALLAVPPLCAAVGAGLAQRRYAVVAWDSAALRGFGAGAAAGLLVWVAVGLAGGPMGTGRMAQIGAPLGDLLVTLVGGMGLGGLVGGLLVAAWQRRRRGANPAGGSLPA